MFLVERLQEINPHRHPFLHQLFIALVFQRWFISGHIQVRQAGPVPERFECGCLFDDAFDHAEGDILGDVLVQESAGVMM